MITPSIITQVHAFATLDDMMQMLNISNQANNEIFDFFWIKGVDYDE